MRQKHPVPKLFTAGLLFALSGMFFNVFHCLKFAFDGQGVDSASIAGGVLDICSQKSDNKLPSTIYYLKLKKPRNTS